MPYRDNSLFALAKVEEKNRNLEQINRQLHYMLNQYKIAGYRETDRASTVFLLGAILGGAGTGVMLLFISLL